MAVVTERKVLVCSTAHVSPATANWLNGQALKAATPRSSSPPAIHMAGHRYGWLLYADEDPNEAWPADVQRLMRKARELGADWIDLDTDGDPIEGLQLYQW